MENEKVKELEVGMYRCGNFFIQKVHMDVKEVGRVPEHIRDVAEQEGYVPALVVGDIGGLFNCMLIFGSSKYLFFDSMDVEDGKFTEDCAKAAEVLLNQMMFAVTVMPDMEYVKNNDKEINDYIDRIKG
jgi:hypothetical protein